jgi:hypothetical protein
MLLQVTIDLFLGDLWVVYRKLSTLSQELSSNTYGCTFTSIASILLVCPSKNGYFLPEQSIMKSCRYSFRESRLLVFVDVDHGAPILSDLRQMKSFRDIDQAQDVLLEARTSESGGRFEHSISNPSV